MPRLMSMIAMLAVLGMLVYRARDPNTWRWLSRIDSTAPQKADEEPSAGPKQSVVGNGQSADSARSVTPQSPIPNPQSLPHAPVVTGPTDEDPEEADAFKEERQAISDRTLYMQREEMPAYDRVVGWVVRQPFSLLRKRARTDVIFGDLIHSPAKYRGQLIELELNVQMLRKIEEQIPSGTQLCEAWGFTTDSGAWLYDTIVVDLPKGMPTGTRINEQVRFVGYFFKIQAYQPALAKPRDPPQMAPMLIGRLVWKQIDLPKVQQSDWMWGYVLIGGFVLIAVVNLAILFRRNRRRGGRPLATTTSQARRLSVDEWLDHVDGDETPQDENHDHPGEPPDNGSHQGDGSGE
jgi:hypothetical protein